MNNNDNDNGNMQQDIVDSVKTINYIVGSKTFISLGILSVSKEVWDNIEGEFVVSKFEDRETICTKRLTTGDDVHMYISIHCYTGHIHGTP